MNIRIANIIIWDNKAFVPSNALYHNGPFISIEPVYILNPTLTELVPVVQSVLLKEPLLLPGPPSREDIKAVAKLLPKITGARSWKRLGQNGISYIIELSEKGYLLEMSRLDKKVVGSSIQIKEKLSRQALTYLSLFNCRLGRA